MSRPSFRYDCKNCNLAWNCGYLCSCVRPMYMQKRTDTPFEVKQEVNATRLLAGLDPEFPEVL